MIIDLDAPFSCIYTGLTLKRNDVLTSASMVIATINVYEWEMISAAESDIKVLLKTVERKSYSNFRWHQARTGNIIYKKLLD